MTDQAARSDRELLAAWRSGDREAADELIERHGPGLYGFFAGKLGRGADACCLRTFAAWQQPPRPDAPSGIRSELLALARVELLAHLREGEREIDPDHHCIAELEPGLTEVVATRAPQRRLLHALRRLPIDDQIALELRHWEALDELELAAVLATTPAELGERLSRATDQLERRLAASTAVDAPTMEAPGPRDDRSR
ncbi:MAG: sigma-70 family RNA polymerase sigma factor [Myxococcales bacterium]|nr:sigma-70 family RNA polymerase sigma factor [Myxococcales bacterium]MCB9717118.1 sigma-70 family RNA polymerase sigma factor [Myxococcales bacterium]